MAANEGNNPLRMSTESLPNPPREILPPIHEEEVPLAPAANNEFSRGNMGAISPGVSLRKAQAGIGTIPQADTFNPFPNTSAKEPVFLPPPLMDPVSQSNQTANLFMKDIPVRSKNSKLAKSSPAPLPEPSYILTGKKPTHYEAKPGKVPPLRRPNALAQQEVKRKKNEESGLVVTDVQLQEQQVQQVQQEQQEQQVDAQSLPQLRPQAIQYQQPIQQQAHAQRLVPPLAANIPLSNLRNSTPSLSAEANFTNWQNSMKV